MARSVPPETIAAFVGFDKSLRHEPLTIRPALLTIRE